MSVLDWPEEEVAMALELMADEAEIASELRQRQSVHDQAAANARALGW